MVRLHWPWPQPDTQPQSQPLARTRQLSEPRPGSARVAPVGPDGLLAACDGFADLPVVARAAWRGRHERPQAGHTNAGHGRRRAQHAVRDVSAEPVARADAAADANAGARVAADRQSRGAGSERRRERAAGVYGYHVAIQHADTDCGAQDRLASC